MIRLTEEMSDLVNNALANGTPCILATASSSGQPNMSYRGSFMVFDDESLAYWDRTRRVSVEHMASNPKVCVLFRHPERRISWRFLGEASIYQEGDIRRQVWNRTVKPERDRDPACQGVAVIIRVNTILSSAGDVLQQR